jgi:hypothetical protein
MSIICSVVGGHLIFIDFPPRRWQGYYAYSSIVVGFLHLKVAIISLPLLRSRHNIPSTPTPHDVQGFEHKHEVEMFT